MNKTLTYIAIASAICGVACSKGHDTASEQSESVDVALPVVDSVTLYKTYPGSLIADREVKLVARVNGYLESKNYQSGDFVKKGTVLFTIESRNYRDAVERARSAVATAEANLQYAQTRYEALAEALKSDAVSRMEVEQGLSTLNECKANLASNAVVVLHGQGTIRRPYHIGILRCRFICRRRRGTGRFGRHIRGRHNDCQVLDK